MSAAAMQAEKEASKNGTQGYYYEREPDAYYYSQAPKRSYYYSGGYADPYGYQTPKAYDIYRNGYYGDPSPYDPHGAAREQVLAPPVIRPYAQANPAPGANVGNLYPSTGGPYNPPVVAGSRTAPLSVRTDPDPDDDDDRRAIGWYLMGGAAAAAAVAGVVALVAQDDDDGVKAPPSHHTETSKPTTSPNPTLPPVKTLPFVPGVGNPNGTNPNGGNANGTNPNGGNPNGTNPNGGNPNGTNPNGGNANGTNPNGGNANGTNPNGGNPNGTNPNGGNPNGTNPNGSNPNGTNPNGSNPNDGIQPRANVNFNPPGNISVDGRVSVNTPAGSTPPGNGATPPGNGATPPGNGATPPGNGATPPGNGSTPPGNGATPPGNGSTPPGNGATPPGNGATPPGNGATPPGNGATPPGNGSTPPGNGSTPPGNGATPPGNGATPPGNGATPPGNGATPPGNGATPPGNGSTPPGNGATPPDNGATSPGNGATSPGNGATPPGNGATPPGNGATPPGNGATPPGNGATPPVNGATPPVNGATPPGTEGGVSEHPFSDSPETHKTEEAGRNPALNMMNAYDAYARGYNGDLYSRNDKGVLLDKKPMGKVKVGIIDGKIDFDDKDLNGAILKDDSVVCTVEGGCVAEKSDGVAAPEAHGSVVAKVLAGRKNGEGSQGMAYNASLVVGRFLDVQSGSDIQAIDHLLNKGVKVINGSYGFLEDGLFDGKPTQKISLPIIADSHTDTAYAPEKLASGLYAMENGMNYITAFSKAVENDVIMVYAGGNNPTDNPAALAGLPYYFRGDIGAAAEAPPGYDVVNPAKLDFSKNWVSVVALDNKGKIASYSGRCGVAKDWCVAAPGDYRANLGKEAVGTSYAAPAVSGAVALMRGAFPHLKGPQVLNILFNTARDLGEPGVDAIYGHGLIDLAKATSPSAGGWKIPMGARFDDGLSAPLSLSRALLPAATGDAALRAKLGAFAFTDAYDRSFKIGADAVVAKSPTAGNGAYAFEKRLGEFAAPRKITSSELTEGVKLVSFQRKLTALPAMTEDGAGMTSAQDAGLKTEQAYMMETETRPSKNVRAVYRQGTGIPVAEMLAAPEGREAQEEAAIRELSRASMYNAFASGFVEMVRSGASASAVRQAGAMRFGYAAFQGKTGDQDAFDPFAKKEGGQAKGMTASADWAKGAFGMNVQAGMVREQNGVLGGRQEGAMALSNDGASTGFAGAAVRYRIAPGVTAGAQYQYGVTTAAPTAGGLVNNLSRMSTDAFSMGVLFKGVAEPHDSFGLTLSQPLRVRSGGLNLRLPDAIGADGSVSYRNETASLKPSGRELALEAHYTMTSDDGKSSFTAGAGLRADPGHERGASPALDFLVKFRREF